MIRALLPATLLAAAAAWFIARPTPELASPADEATRAAPTPTANPYLAIGVQLEKEHWFHRVSFKDVGLREVARDGRDALVEAVAEGVAASLSPDLEAHPVHAAELADPAWHSSCQGKHVYVDVWHSSQPDRIGFSLWRGCDADDQFGWQEVPVDASALQSTSWVTEAARVGRVIGAALAACGEHTC
ncbi:MAG: hypothetical protein H6704_04700 [Myxococcales bacterium]|nr:hypothetical protein [Myxococcales bacterium]